MRAQLKLKGKNFGVHPWWSALPRRKGILEFAPRRAHLRKRKEFLEFAPGGAHLRERKEFLEFAPRRAHLWERKEKEVFRSCSEKSMFRNSKLFEFCTRSSPLIKRTFLDFYGEDSYCFRTVGAPSARVNFWPDASH